ncbi:MAG: acyltransferase [Phycisphaerae bacterium]|nr:acyltransferase [Phycisphaerae bacterium]
MQKSSASTNPSSGFRNPDHLRHIDGLRACLALYVVIDHICLTIWPAGQVNAARAYRAAFDALTEGRIAVDWFIVVSGFCLMLPTLSRGYKLRGTIGEFYVKRARRILPTYWVAVIISAILCLTVLSHKTGTHWDICLPVTWQALASAFLLTNDIFQNIRINHVFWSIAVEWRIYFLFPLILWLWRKWGGGFATAAIIACTASSAFVLPHISKDTLFLQTTLSFTGLFAMGGFAAYLSFGFEPRDLARFKHTIWTVAAISGALIVASLLHLLPHRLSRDPVLDVFVGVSAAACMVSWSIDDRSLFRAFLSWPPLVSIGLFAYSLYLMHAPIVQLCWQVCIRPAKLHGLPAFTLLVFIATPIAVAGGYLFSLAFERPFLSSRQRAATLPAAQALSSNLEMATDLSLVS